MRWRDSDSVMSAPMLPENVYEIDIDLMTVAYIFAKGHRIRVTVSSAAAPFYNPNFNTGKSEVTDDAQQPVIARNVIHFSPKYHSSVSLPVVSLKDIPPNKHFVTGPMTDVSSSTKNANQLATVPRFVTKPDARLSWRNERGSSA